MSEEPLIVRIAGEAEHEVELSARAQRLQDICAFIASDCRATVDLMVSGGWDPALAEQSYIDYIRSLVSDAAVSGREWADHP